MQVSIGQAQQGVKQLRVSNSRIRPFRASSNRRSARASRRENIASQESVAEEAYLAVQDTLQVMESSVSQMEDAFIGPPHQASNSPGDASRRRRAEKARHQLTYKVAAITASLGVTSVAVLAVHYRFAWHVGDKVPWEEAAACLLLVFGGVAGMEMWARWAHKTLWHDFAPGWALHKSHHAPRIGPFEANDVFAIINAAPAIWLCYYGFYTPTILGGIAFGSGLGITLFGMMYMFVHDGLVHKRFPVGPLADVPYLKRIAAAHKLHHAERFNGVPWGLFLGPQELEAVGGTKDLEYMCQQMDKINEREKTKA